MKLRHVFAVVAAAMALAVVAMYPVTVFDWFSQNFGHMADGTVFTGQDAVGGQWDAIPEGVATVATRNGRKCIDFDASHLTSGEIQFSATNALSQVVRVDFSIGLEPLFTHPDLEAGDKGALCLLSTNQVGVLAFGGYTADGWKTLYGHGLVQHDVEWLDCRAEFDYSDSVPYVTYFHACGDGQYETLADTNGVSRFAAPDVGKVSKVAFRGNGCVGDLLGFGLVGDSTRTIQWTGDKSQDWDDAENWLPKKVPGDGDVAEVGGGNTISCKGAAGDDYVITTVGTVQRLVYADGRYLRVLDGEIEIYVASESGFPGMVIAESGTTVRLDAGRYGGIDVAWDGTLVLDGKVVVTDRPFYLDGVNLVLGFSLSSQVEAVEIMNAPYGSGGVAATLASEGGGKLTKWKAAWHGKLDGSSSLWMVNASYDGDTARWNEGAWGRLVLDENWGVVKPSSQNAAWMGSGKAHVNKDEEFLFTRRFEIGGGTNVEGEVSMSDGGVTGKNAGAAIVGSGEATGILDVVGGTVSLQDYLWTSALTIGMGTNATGTVKVGVGSTTTSRILASGGGVSVGEGGAATLEVGSGPRIVGEVSADGSVGVGYDGELIVSGGKLTGEGSFYVGRSAREQPYDVSMAVSDGVVMNKAFGAFWVGSYGGIGSRATMTISGGEVSATNLFVCGGYRSASVEVAGGSLSAPEIRIGHALIDENDYARFVLRDGRVSTGGFTVGENGERSISLIGGRIVATTTNDDFFAGIDVVRLEGETAFDNDDDIVIRSALTGPGGLVKEGVGTNTVAGYAAWGGLTKVCQGVLDLDGGMIMGEISLGEGAAVDHAKYDAVDALFPFLTEETWASGVASTRPFVYIDFSMSADGATVASAVDGDGVVKGSVKSVVDETTGERTFFGWTALGWVALHLPDGATPEEGVAYDLRMLFDFREGKPYVMYYVDDGDGYARMESDDGLTVFPVEGSLLNVVAFSGVSMTAGRQLFVADGRVFYWIGPDGGAWNAGENWSYSPGGVAAGTYPTGDAVAIFERSAFVTVPEAAKASALLVNANLRLAGEQSLSVASGISGVGSLTLSNATLQAAAASVSIGVPVVVAEGTENVLLSAPAKYAFVVNGSLRGAGTLALTALNRRPMCGAVLAGDNSAFAGVLKIYPYWSAREHQQLDAPCLATPRASSAGAQWEINVEHEYAGDLNPATGIFGTGNATYFFGSLKADFRRSGEFTSEVHAYWVQDDVTLEVGALDRDSRADGVCAGEGGAIDWVAPTATFRNGVSGLAALRLRGGGTLVVEDADALPAEAITFADDGGELVFEEPVDISGLITNSTAPVVFNGGSGYSEWHQSPDASNVGGFVKRGSGTLVWYSIPPEGMDVSVESGTLVVPFGTRLGRVVVADGAALVVDFSDAVEDAVCFAAASANRPLNSGKFLQFQSVPEGYSYRILVGMNNATIVVNGSQTYEWTGAAKDECWSTCGNWKVGSTIPDDPPSDNDMVRYGVGCHTTRLDAVSFDLALEALGDLTFSGANTLLSRMYLDVDGLLGFCPSPMSPDDEDDDYYGATNRLGVTVSSTASVGSIAGQGRLAVGSGDLAVFTAEDHTDRFVGTLEAANFVKRGKGTFEFIGDGAFSGSVAIERGTLRIGSYRDIDGIKMDFDASDEDTLTLDDDGCVERWTSPVGECAFDFAGGQRAQPTKDWFDGRNAVMLRPQEAGSSQYSRYDLSPANPTGVVSRSLFMVYVPVGIVGGCFAYAQYGSTTRCLRLHDDLTGHSWYCPESGFGETGIFTGCDYGSQVVEDGIPALTFWSDSAIDDAADVVECLGATKQMSGLRGAIGEVVSYVRTLTHAEREIVTRQLMSKWGVADSAECMGIHAATPVTMNAEATLDLGGQTLKVGSFTGAGTVANGVLVTADGIITQSGGDLTLSAADGMTYVASNPREKLIINDAAGKDIRIVVPRSWFSAGDIGSRTFFCESKHIDWDIQLKSKNVKIIDEGDGWWTVGGFGFTVRIR